MSNPPAPSRRLWFAGIGTRTPFPEHVEFIVELAAKLNSLGWLLATGDAKGIDLAWRRGWGFCGSPAYAVAPPYRDPEYWGKAHKQFLFQLAGLTVELYHPNPFAVAKNRFGYELHTRNAFIILGPNLSKPVSLVVWSCLSPHPTGGTSQGTRLAAALGIPTFGINELFSPDRRMHVGITETIALLYKRAGSVPAPKEISPLMFYYGPLSMIVLTALVGLANVVSPAALLSSCIKLSAEHAECLNSVCAPS